MDPITLNVVIPSIVNISCSFLTDLFKVYKNRTRSKTLTNEVQKFIFEYIDTELDSGGFVKFLGLPETTRDFVDFINYCTYRKQSNSKKTKFLLDKITFIDYISKKSIAFVQDDVGKSINEVLVRGYFTAVINILEDKLIEQLGPDNIGVLYFLNNSLKETEQRIIQSITSTDIVRQNHDHELVKEQYLKILKLRNKKSHVYGIDDLDLYSFYVFPKFHASEAEETRSDTIIEIKEKPSIVWTDIFKESNMVSVIGGAGFGKSLFLKNLINKFHELNIYDSSELMPIYCDLKQFKLNAKNNFAYSIEDFLIDCIIANTGIDKRLITKEYLNYFLMAGRCLILFDALDEVEVEERQDLNDLISSFFEVTNKHNKIIITSRSQGFIPKTRIVYKVCSVDKDQIEEYLTMMVKLRQFNVTNVVEFTRQCDGLIQSGFLTSLLTVSLLVQIYKAEKELPENKIDLYEKCVEYISKKREKDQKKSNFNFKLMSNILDNNISFEKLAWLSRPNNVEIKENEIKAFFLEIYEESYSSKNETRNAIDEFLKFCAQRTELYVAGNQEEHYRFYHRSFYEFFYSKCIINEYTENNLLFEELLKFGFDSEMFELTISLLKKHNYDRFKLFIKFLFDSIENIESIDNIEKEEMLLKACIMLNCSDQIQYCNKIYDYCFNENRVLKELENDNAHVYILPLLIKVENKMSRKLENDIISFYREEVVVAFLIKHMLRTPGFRFFDINLNYTFGALESQMNRAILREITTIYTIEELEGLLLRYVKVEAEKNNAFRRQLRKCIKKLSRNENVS
ncbi:hypothetical protein QW71_09870 [Paenibacillus sp. IHB B 3415]|uniref:NACHT domain-containing protein n=1 Tax=Paenibacillus sp. IHB B 3415 TaxID=867080 RepID=UPI0005751CE7|nr:NACHT domain-containing protein [Paenibacillus sp. IHB B 3415]KHL95904.1 hypothetical protein QW71_09870 [Paenibacillus sp. IHB B 3415]